MAMPTDRIWNISAQDTGYEVGDCHDVETPSESRRSDNSQQSELEGDDIQERGEIEKDATEADSDENDDAETDSDENDDSEIDGEPGRPYSNEDLASSFIDFYKFLASLHYNLSDLKLPPPEGWDTALLPSELLDKKSDLVVDLMRHMPYFKARNSDSTQIHYKSILIDYTDPQEHNRAISIDEFIADDPIDDDTSETALIHSNLLILARGYESGGRTFVLDVRNGQVHEEMIRCSYMGAMEVPEWIGELSTKFSDLKLISCPGRETQEAEYFEVPERDDLINAEDVRKQEESWGTHLDWQFVRQIYRQHGWPEEFRREDAFKAVEDFMVLDEERRGDWECCR